MSTFGCHRCKVNLKDWEGKPYEQWPCASCTLAKDYSRTFSTGYFDTASLEGVEDESAELGKDADHEFIIGNPIELNENELQSLEVMQKAIAHQIYAMFSGILVRLLHMAKTNPIMFEVFIKKMQFPYMSYAEIGDSMEPRCSKQNVLYHLKCVVDQFPELLSVISTDTRYSGGRYALKTVADRRRAQIAEEQVQKTVYGEKFKDYHFMDMKTLNKILHLPFNMRDEVFTFNAYLDDDRRLADMMEEEEEKKETEDAGTASDRD